MLFRCWFMYNRIALNLMVFISGHNPLQDAFRGCVQIPQRIHCSSYWIFIRVSWSSFHSLYRYCSFKYYLMDTQHLHYLSTRLCPWSFRRHEWVRQVVPQCWYYHWHGFLEKIELHKSCPDSEIDLQLTIASGKSLTTELSRVIVEILNQHWAM